MNRRRAMRAHGSAFRLQLRGKLMCDWLANHPDVSALVILAIPVVVATIIEAAMHRAARRKEEDVDEHARFLGSC